MQFDERTTKQAIILSSREIDCLIGFSCKDDKVHTLNGASVLLDGKSLTAYATDGNRSVRGSCKLRENFDRYEWLIPRSALLLASRVLIDGQEAHFPLQTAKCLLGGFEVWSITTDTEADNKLDWIEFAQPIAPNTQMGLPFEAIDCDLDREPDTELEVAAKFSAGVFLELKKVALAGLTPNLQLQLGRNGLLHGTTDGGTQWHAVIKPVSLEVSKSNGEEDAEGEGGDPSINSEGELELTPSDKKRTRRPRKSKVVPIGKGKGKRGKK